ncbi:MAG TPA: hypothetical protein VHF26_14295 [Trebonia sp.]|nr:hypothetical protein [Trebonia sp.]
MRPSQDRSPRSSSGEATPRGGLPQSARPTLLSSCARASTAAESRFRINAPAFTPRSSRVIALDSGAAELVRDLARDQRWGGGHFLVFESAVPDDALLRRVPGPAAGPGDDAPEGPDGPEGPEDPVTALLSEELNGSDTVVMVASAEGAAAAEGSASAASIIGDAAAARAIMTAGLVVPGDVPGDQVVAALRPNAMVLVILRDATDLPEVLAALRV